MALRGAAARRYAQAVFDMARDTNSLDQWLNDLRTLVSIFGNENAVTTLEDPRLTDEDQRRIVGEKLPKGTVSDLKNIGQERRAGSIAGAVFLESFVKEGIPWAHIDIAAVALIREDRPLSARGATGFGVRLTLELLKNWQ